MGNKKNERLQRKCWSRWEEDDRKEEEEDRGMLPSLPPPRAGKWEWSTKTRRLVGKEILDEKKRDNLKSENSMITRSLSFDEFLKKSESSELSDCSSAVTYKGRSVPEDDDDDDASVWSIQMHASARDTDEDEEEVAEGGGGNDYYEYDEEGGEEEEGSLLLDDLCQGMRKMSVGMS
ncbi:hypothetical protein Dimus_017365 [Dionaea muscipula]